MNNFSKQEIADIIYCLKKRRDGICDYIRFVNEIINDSNKTRTEVLNNCLINSNKEVDELNFLIVKLEKEL